MTKKLLAVILTALALVGLATTSASAQAEPPDIAQAEASYGEALALAIDLGMRPLAAHCHLGLGTLYQKIGRAGEAQAELAKAAEMYRSMEMAFWLAKAAAELARES